MDPIKIFDSFGCAENRMRLLFEGKNLQNLKINDLNVSIQLLRRNISSEMTRVDTEIGWTESLMTNFPSFPKWQNSIVIEIES